MSALRAGAPPFVERSFGRRRRFIAAAAVPAAAAVAGCSSLRDRTGATDVVAYNAADEPKVVAVTVTPSGADTAHTARTLELAPNEGVDPVNDSKLPTDDGYTVEVSVEGGPTETFAWENPRLELAPLSVVVDGRRNVRFLLQAG